MYLLVYLFIRAAIAAVEITVALAVVVIRVAIPILAAALQGLAIAIAATCVLLARGARWTWRSLRAARDRRVALAVATTDPFGNPS